MLGEIGRVIYEGRRFKAFIIILLLHYVIRRNTKGAGVGEQPDCAYDITRARCFCRCLRLYPERSGAVSKRAHIVMGKLKGEKIDDIISHWR